LSVTVYSLVIRQKMFISEPWSSGCSLWQQLPMILNVHYATWLET
jgi:hypothetical protein